MDKFSLNVLAILALGIAFGAAGTFFLIENVRRPTSNIGGQEGGEVVRLKVPGAADAAPGVSGGVQYENVRYGFSLRYPTGLAVQEFDEGTDSFTIVFQKPGEQVGFQIYITPHQGETLSGETIRRDVPSGVIGDLMEEQIRPDILAATFTSEAPLTGKNKEIWFIRGGYLFEFTAYAAAESMVREVLQTIMFQ